VALPAFARCTPPLQKSMDISCTPGPQQKPAAAGLLLWAHAGQ